ncbi:hypothetical protein [Legionella hackeliae]|nr:hypothetical protein [Legionella hackeliae]
MPAEEILKKLQEIQEIHFVGRRLSDKTIILILLKKLPLFTNFLHSIDNTGNTLSKLAVIQGQAVQSALAASQGFQWANLGLALVDFFRIPLIYLAAILIGQKPPITLNKNARWLYSAVLLAFTITALAVPVAAPPIAMVTAIIGLGVSIFLLAKHLRNYQRIKAALQAINTKIADKEDELQELQTLAKNLQQTIKGNPEKLEELRAEFVRLEKIFQALAQEMQPLYDEQTHLSQKLAKMNVVSLIDKTMAIALSSLVIIGLAISLAFPVIGLGIVAATAALGGAYILARILTPLFIDLGKKLMNKLFKKDDAFSTESTKGLSPKMQLESTGVAMVKLHSEQGAMHALEEQVSLLQQLEYLENKLHAAAQHEGSAEFLQVMKEIARFAQEHPLNLEEWRELLSREAIQPYIHPLQQAIMKMEMIAKEKEQLISHEPLVTALQEKGIDLAQIKVKNLTPAKHVPGLFHEEHDTAPPSTLQKTKDFSSSH